MTRRVIVLAIAIGMLPGMTGWGVESSGAAQTEALSILSVSNRADLVSGGDALLQVELPAGVSDRDLTVTVGDKAFEGHVGPDGRSVLTRLEGLAVGENVVTATGRGLTSRLVVTNHPVGGPVFSGPQLEPWFCDTEAAGLGPAIDPQCNAPTRFRFYYKSAATGQFERYDTERPPPGADIATAAPGGGRPVPYIVRVESMTVNRGISFVAAIIDPTRPWEPWAPQPGWNGKLYWVFGNDCAPGHRQATDPTVGAVNGSDTPGRAPQLAPAQQDPTPSRVTAESGGDDTVLDNMALSRGFMVAASTLTNLGNSCNTVLHAETMMMTKEHIIERYGPIHYTIGSGCSGGSMSQHGIASQYPGLIDGLRPTCSFPDYWSVGTVNGFDCVLLNRYFDTDPSSRTFDGAGREAVYGYDNGPEFCRHPLGAFRPSGWDPRVGGEGTLDFAAPVPCVPKQQVYEPDRNPGGIRCSFQDYLVNIVGRRPAEAWGPVERKVGHGFANRFLDNVGVQYGLAALEAAQITPEQFVDLNAHVGGWDIDANWQPERSVADGFALDAMYRSGQIIDGRALDETAIIDYRSNWTKDVHDNRQATFTRRRILSANGNTRNHAQWLEPNPLPFGLPSTPLESFMVMDRWLADATADRSSEPIGAKLARHRPADAADGCFVEGHRVDPGTCASVTLPSDPRLVAGTTDTRDILKCQLKPLDRHDYRVSFSDQQWSRLRQAFPTGVCDWSKPGVGQQRNVPWLTYADGPGGHPLGPPPVSTPVF